MLDAAITQRAQASGADWFDAPEQLVGIRGVREGESWFDLHQVTQLEEAVFGNRRPKWSGKIGDGEVKQLSRFVRSARRLLRDAEHLVALVWMRDTDGAPDLGSRLRAALNEPPLQAGDPPALVACPHQASEAWVAAGYRPQDESDRGALNQLTQDLGFDPTAEPERLLHQEGGERSGKRVLCELVGSDLDRERACVRHAVTSANEGVQRAVGLRPWLNELDSTLLDSVFGRVRY